MITAIDAPTAMEWLVPVASPHFRHRASGLVQGSLHVSIRSLRCKVQSNMTVLLSVTVRFTHPFVRLFAPLVA